MPKIAELIDARDAAAEELFALRSRVQAAPIPVDRPHRKKLQRATKRLVKLFWTGEDRLAWRRDELQRAIDAERERQWWARRELAAVERPKLAAWIYRRLRKMGFAREHASGVSRYYRHRELGEFAVRISDHEVPETDERRHNCEVGGFSWATCGWSLVVEEGTREEWWAAARWLVEVRRNLKRELEKEQTRWPNTPCLSG